MFRKPISKEWMIFFAEAKFQLLRPRFAFSAVRGMPYYAVRRGRETGVYKDWNACRKQVEGYRGCEFKKFRTFQDALQYMNEAKASKPHDEKQLSLSNTFLATKRKIEKKIDPKYALIDLRQRIKSAIVEDKDRPKGTLIIYTDGSCTVNRNVAYQHCPAGWGFVALDCEDHGNLRVLQEQCGIVCVNSDDAHYLGADVTSNNTAELSALGYAIRWCSTQIKNRTDKRIVFRSDSLYAARSITGVYNGKKNRELIDNIRKMLVDLENNGFKTEFCHVKGHTNNEWNERADRLARQGASGYVRIDQMGTTLEETAVKQSSKRLRKEE